MRLLCNIFRPRPSFRKFSHRPNDKLYNILGSMSKTAKATKVQVSRSSGSSVVYLQVLGSGAPGAARSLYVYTRQASFLFNCGEGSQRLAQEHGAKLGTIEHVLITHKSWSNVGGLSGILLTLQQMGVQRVNIHGPAGIESHREGTKHFMKFYDLNIKYRCYCDNNGFTDGGALTIESVPLWAKEESYRNSNEKELMDEVIGEVEEEEDSFVHQKQRLRKKKELGVKHLSSIKKKQVEEESRKCKNLAVAYICTALPTVGKFSIERCVEIRVPPGPHLLNLKRGEDVTLPNGRVILASEVRTPDDPGSVFIVVEAPSEAYLDSLLHSPAFFKHQTSATSDEFLAEVIVHFTPSHVMKHPRYQEWMSRFSPSTSHICINEDSLCMGLEAVHRLQYKLNLLSKVFFPLLKDQSISQKRIETIEACDLDKEDLDNQSGKNMQIQNSKDIDQTAIDNSGNFSLNSDYSTGPVHQAKTLMTYHIKPKRKLDRSSELVLNPETYISDCFAMENFESLLKEAKPKIVESITNAEGCNNFPNVIFLGTGSAMSNNTRNASGILLNLSSDKTLIMDCGEGTYGQLVRFYGLTESEKILRQLSAVYVSHRHIDHHLGFIQLLLARRQAFKRIGKENVPKLLFLAPPKIIDYLLSYDRNFESILDDFSLVENHNFLSSEFKNSEIFAGIKEHLDMKSIEMTKVIHCPNAFGVAWTHKDGWKIAYSGDTMPCENLVKIGQDCDILIHEATMEDQLLMDAKFKKHSTISQAIQVGRDMNARHILLTHFSQRYAKVPFLESEVPENVGIAFDNMKVSLYNLPKISHMYQVLVTMFSENYNEMKERAFRRRVAETWTQCKG